VLLYALKNYDDGMNNNSMHGLMIWDEHILLSLCKNNCLSKIFEHRSCACKCRVKL